LGYKPVSFRGHTASSESASKVHKLAARKSSRQEELLASALEDAGVPYRRHAKELPGNPDFAIDGARVAVFCDGTFWHGYQWSTRRPRLLAGSNGAYWVAKIEYNMARDRWANEALTNLGWRVLRLWEVEVNRDVVGCVLRIVSSMR
jgi:DNA mismatch endonuclease (patch repair protein)